MTQNGTVTVTDEHKTIFALYIEHLEEIAATHPETIGTVVFQT